MHKNDDDDYFWWKVSSIKFKGTNYLFICNEDRTMSFWFDQAWFTGKVSIVLPNTCQFAATSTLWILNAFD